MQFFNETVSNYLQFVSMFMEVIGISLAYIEIRYKPLKFKIEAKILAGETRMRQMSWRLAQNNLFSALITVFVIVVFFFEIPYMAGLFDKLLPQEWQDFQETLYWLTFPVILLFFLVLFVILLGEFVSWLNRFSEGHALGALGVVVTSIGLTGEIYQILTIFYG